MTNYISFILTIERDNEEAKQVPGSERQCFSFYKLINISCVMNLTTIRHSTVEGIENETERRGLCGDRKSDGVP